MHWADESVGGPEIDGAKNTSRYSVGATVPVRVNLGVDARRVIAEARRPFRPWTFVGPDGVANNADNTADNYDLVDSRNSSIPAPYGNGAWQYPSSWNAYDLFRAHPEYFVHDNAYEVQQNALNSNVITEDIISEYLRFDARLFENRLWIVAGARYERTRDDGYGRGRQRQGAIGGTAEPGTFAYMHPRLTLDCEAEYRFSRRLGLFAGGRNITGAPFIIERYGANTPGYARRHQRNDYGIALSAGVKASF